MGKKDLNNLHLLFENLDTYMIYLIEMSRKACTIIQYT